MTDLKQIRENLRTDKIDKVIYQRKSIREILLPDIKSSNQFRRVRNDHNSCYENRSGAYLDLGE